MAKDATALTEQDIELAAKQVVKWLTQEGPRVANRPPLSKPLTPTEMHNEWTANKDDANWWADRFKRLAVVHGPLNAARQLLDFDKEMKGKVGNGNG